MKSATGAGISECCLSDVLQNVDGNNVRRVPVDKKDVGFTVIQTAFYDILLEFLHEAKLLWACMKYESVVTYHEPGGLGSHTHAA